MNPRPLPCQCSALGPVTLFKSTSARFPKKISHCMHCFNCSISTFLCAKLCATFYHPSCDRESQKDLQKTSELSANNYAPRSPTYHLISLASLDQLSPICLSGVFPLVITAETGRHWRIEMTIRHEPGHLRCTKRKNGPSAWEFLWRENCDSRV